MLITWVYEGVFNGGCNDIGSHWGLWNIASVETTQLHRLFILVAVDEGTLKGCIRLIPKGYENQVHPTILEADLGTDPSLKALIMAFELPLFTTHTSHAQSLGWTRMGAFRAVILATVFSGLWNPGGGSFRVLIRDITSPQY